MGRQLGVIPDSEGTGKENIANTYVVLKYFAHTGMDEWGGYDMDLTTVVSMLPPDLLSSLTEFFGTMLLI